jgi:hypothetical protein
MVCSENKQKIVQIGKLMIKILLDSGEAVIKQMDSKSVVPHVDNRGGSRMQTQKIYATGEKMLSVGFCLDLGDEKKAICFGVDPNRRASVMNFLGYSQDDPSSAMFLMENVEGLSVGCGHFNQFVAAIKDQRPVPPSFRKSDMLIGLKASGITLDKAHIIKKDLLFYGGALTDVLDGGLKWTYIRPHVEALYPKLPKAFNVEHHVREGPHGQMVASYIGISFVC